MAPDVIATDIARREIQGYWTVLQLSLDLQTRLVGKDPYKLNNPRFSGTLMFVHNLGGNAPPG